MCVGVHCSLCVFVYMCCVYVFVGVHLCCVAYVFMWKGDMVDHEGEGDMVDHEGEG